MNSELWYWKQINYLPCGLNHRSAHILRVEARLLEVYPRGRAWEMIFPTSPSNFLLSYKPYVTIFSPLFWFLAILFILSTCPETKQLVWMESSKTKNVCESFLLKVLSPGNLSGHLELTNKIGVMRNQGKMRLLF